MIKIFEGSFGGATLYENPSYVTPNAVRVDLIMINVGCMCIRVTVSLLATVKSLVYITFSDLA